MLRQTKPQIRQRACTLAQGWGTFADNTSGAPRVERRAVALYKLLVGHGLTTCPPETLDERIDELVRAGLVKHRGRFIAILLRLDFALIREGRIPGFAVKHIIEYADDLLAG